MLLRRLGYVSLVIAVALPGAQRSSSASVPAERILEALAVGEGATVCEIGAGDGELSFAAARLVGPKGRVYTNELGEARVRRLRERVEASGQAHINVVAGESAKTNFPDSGCNALFLRDVYHHVTQPGLLNASVASAVKPGGRVVVVDFTPPGEEASAPADRAKDGKHGVSPETVAREMKAAGLEAVTTERPGGRWFLVVLEKPRL